MTEAQIDSELRDNPDSLFVQASNPLAAFQYLVGPAENKLVSLGPKLTGLWASKLGSESARESDALIRIHEKLFDAGDTTDVPMLIDSLRSDVGLTRRMATYLLGFSKCPSAVMPLVGMLDNPDWRTRASAAESLWRLHDRRAEAGLLGALHDSVALVRHSAALALGKAAGASADSALVAALGDESQIVRHSAVQALGLHPSSAGELRDLVAADTSVAALGAMRALALLSSDTTHSVDTVAVNEAIVRGLSTDEPWPIRAAAADCASAWKARMLLAKLTAARAVAKQQYAIERLDAAIAALKVAPADSGRTSTGK